MDLNVLIQKFKKEIGKDQQFIITVRKKLENEQFIRNAPPELIAEERNKLEEAQRRTEKLEAYIRDMA